MPRCQRIGAEIARRFQQVAELDALVAADARDRRLAAAVALGEILDDRFAEPGLVIEHVMRDAEKFGDARCIADILSRAAGPLAAGRGAVVIKLQCDADDLEPGARQQRRDHRGVDAARHRHDDPMAGGVAG